MNQVTEVLCAMFSIEGMDLDEGIPGLAGPSGASPPSPAHSADLFLLDESSDSSLYGSDQENRLHTSSCSQWVEPPDYSLVVSIVDKDSPSSGSCASLKPKLTVLPEICDIWSLQRFRNLPLLILIPLIICDSVHTWTALSMQFDVYLWLLASFFHSLRPVRTLCVY